MQGMFLCTHAGTLFHNAFLCFIYLFTFGFRLTVSERANTYVQYNNVDTEDGIFAI